MSDLVYIQVAILVFYLIVMVGAFIGVAKNMPLRKVYFNSVVIFILLVISSYLCYCRFTLPVLNINGENKVTIKLFEEYKDEGYELIHPNDKLQDISKEFKNDKTKGIDFFVSGNRGICKPLDSISEAIL